MCCWSSLAGCPAGILAVLMSKAIKRSQPTDVTLGSRGNVDGKGLNGFMLDWYQTEPRSVVAKPQRQVLAEFFTSMLILSAHFKYKPSIGTDNYLYYVDDNWLLSLIAPQQWSDKHRVGFAGTCKLQRDMTWTIEPSEQLLGNEDISAAVGRFFDAFAETMDTDLTLEEILPFYVRRMPYWQRLHASALSRSIRGTINLGDQGSMSAREWQAALPASSRSFFPRSNDT